METATFAAGSFWKAEEAFASLPGVIETRVGYCGGHTPSPSYEQVYSGQTGHAEAVQVDYDPSRISYQQLLEVFWKIHDPTALHRLGPFVGAQYRSIIFCHTPQQQADAQASKDNIDAWGIYRRPIVTEVRHAVEFYPAEEAHQHYYQKRREAGMVMIAKAA